MEMIGRTSGLASIIPAQVSAIATSPSSGKSCARLRRASARMRGFGLGSSTRFASNGLGESSAQRRGSFHSSKNRALRVNRSFLRCALRAGRKSPKKRKLSGTRRCSEAPPWATE